MENFWLFAIFLLFHANKIVCDENPCRHTLSTTDVMDLTKLKGQELIAYAPSNQTYVFSICNDSSSLPTSFLEAKSCTQDGGFSLCLYNNTSPENSVKLAKTAAWKWTEEAGQICLTADYKALKLHIVLSCLSSSGTKGDSSFFVATPPAVKDDIISTFHLISYAACPQKVSQDEGLSTGAVLMIILLLAFLVYLVIGIVVNFFMLGARGVEVVPNITFWRNLPGLVMDGVRFIQNGCKVRPSDLVQGRDTYDSI